LYWEQHGSGPPLVCLHGFGASTYTWREVLASFTRTHTVYALDLKGFGRSPKPLDDAYAPEDQARLVLDFIDRRGLRQVILAGHSYGGGVALTTALALRQRGEGWLHGLILLGAASYPQDFPAFIRLLRWPIAGWFAARAPVRFAVRFVLRSAYYDPARIPEASIVEYGRALHERGGRHALRQTAKQILPADVDAICARYPTLHVPALLVWGRHDTIVPLAIGQRLASALPQAELVVAEDVAHLPHEETPAAVRPAIEAFLKARLTADARA
jgi:pimeloyl-ACP methyl ester carboxylesterase